MNKIEKIKKINWSLEWGRKCSVLDLYCILYAWTQLKKFKWRFNNIVMFRKGEYTTSYLSMDDMKKAEEKLYEICIKKGFVKEYEKSANKANERFVKASIVKKFEMKQYKEWVDAQSQQLRHVATIRVLNRIGERKLKEFINSKEKKPKEQVRIFSVLTSSTRQSPYSDFYEKIKKAQKLKKEGKDITWLVKNVTEEFKWIPVGYGDEPEWNEKDIKKQIETFKEEPGESKQKILNKLTPPEKVRRLIEVMSRFTYYKDQLRRITNYCHYYSRPLFRELAHKNNITFEEIKTYLPDRFGKSVKDTILFADNGKIHLMRYDEKLEKEIIGTKKKIIGTVASLGKAEGEVVIINTMDDLKKNYEHKILVTVMTTPDMVAAIRKSKAIVTDEGGITSHAATISRELKVPCIIGTKIATKVLKDGDLVEVDANKGVVRKIKR